jgi:hypothetical protein
MLVRKLVVYLATLLLLSSSIVARDVRAEDIQTATGNFSSRDHGKACAGSIAEAKRACAPGLTHHREFKCDCTLDKKKSPEWTCVGHASCTDK